MVILKRNSICCKALGSEVMEDCVDEDTFGSPKLLRRAVFVRLLVESKSQRTKISCSPARMTSTMEP